MYLVVPFDFTPVFLSLRTGISLIKRSIPGAKLEKKAKSPKETLKTYAFGCGLVLQKYKYVLQIIKCNIAYPLIINSILFCHFS